MSGPTFLELHSVSAPSRRRYQLEFVQFLRWSSLHGHRTTTVGQLDVALTAYLNELYFRGYIGSDATKLIAAVAFMRPDLQRGSHQLPRASQAARGFVRLSPAHSRLPTPWALICLVMEQLARSRQLHEAFACLLQFALFLRPSEVLGIRVRNAIQPQGRGRRQMGPAQWSIVLHPREDQKASKVGAYDESMLLDSPLLAPLVPFLQRRILEDPDGPLFRLTYRQWSAAFRSAGAAAGLPNAVVPTLYQSRHGGASHEALHHVRSWEAIQVRGRWADQKGMHRYCKPGRLEHQLQRLPPGLRIAADDAVESIGGSLRALLLAS